MCKLLMIMCNTILYVTFWIPSTWLIHNRLHWQKTPYLSLSSGNFGWVDLPLFWASHSFSDNCCDTTALDVLLFCEAFSMLVKPLRTSKSHLLMLNFLQFSWCLKSERIVPLWCILHTVKILVLSQKKKWKSLAISLWYHCFGCSIILWSLLYACKAS